MADESKPTGASTAHAALPEGWLKEVKQRQGGSSRGRADVYVYSPNGTKLRSRAELERYIVSKGYTGINPDLFFPRLRKGKADPDAKAGSETVARADGGGSSAMQRPQPAAGDKLLVKMEFSKSRHPNSDAAGPPKRRRIGKLAVANGDNAADTNATAACVTALPGAVDSTQDVNGSLPSEPARASGSVQGDST